MGGHELRSLDADTLRTDGPALFEIDVPHTLAWPLTCKNCQHTIAIGLGMHTGDCCNWAVYCRDCLVHALAVLDAAMHGGE